MQPPDTGSIVTLKCKLGTFWNADIEFNDLSTLDQVHYAIQDAVDFDNDHLYEFFVARTERSRADVRYTCDEALSFGCDEASLFETRIRDVFPLPQKRFLYYLFDYGDSWIFRISPSRKKPRSPVEGTDYPRVVKESGEKPVQYDSEEW